MTSKFLNISTDTTLGGSSASDNTVASQKAVKAYADTKQDTLVSGTNIKTVGGTSLLGSGNVAFPTVDQTYSATSTNAQSGVAVASAIGNGTVTINQGGTARGTFTMNQSSNLTIDLDGTSGVSAIAILNKNTASPYQTLGIWQGTESQWEHDVTVWYNWRTSINITSQNGGNLPSSDHWYKVAYGNNTLVTVLLNKNSAYSTDSGLTWQSGGNIPFPSGTSAGRNSICFGGDRFLVCADASYQVTAYSTDGGITWQSGGNIPFSPTPNIAYGGDRFLVCTASSSNPAKTAYSTDGGITWQSGGNLPILGSNCVGYGNGTFIILQSDKGVKTAYSTDGGITWQRGGDLPFEGYSGWIPPTYCGDRFITFNAGYGTKTAYSTDGGITWQRGGDLPSSKSWRQPIYKDGIIFVIGGGYSNATAYSTDGGITWQSGGDLPSYGDWQTPAMVDNKIISLKRSSNQSAIVTVSYDSCYTDTANPTTTSVVYSTPDTTSALTISSVTSGAITLSNNNTYYYNQSGNVQTYDTIGNSHPEYLCFIDGVGVKIGNTLIAGNTPITTTITSTSTDTEVPSAKAVYDEMDKVKLTVNLTGYVSYFKNFIIDNVTYSYGDFTNDSLIIRVPRNIDLSWSANSQGVAYVPSPSSGTINTNTDYTLTINLVFNM